MRFPPRWRILLLLLVACFVGWVTISWGWVASAKLVQHYRGGGYCAGDWRDLGNAGCRDNSLGVTYHPLLGWIEILGCIAVLCALGWVLARWALSPFRAMTDTVDRLGPTSLGVRLNADGPRDESRNLSDAIDAMLDRVAEGYEAQRRFAANASHELRTPLATQRALIEISLGAPLTDDQRDLLARQLLSTNERNEHLIEGLLSLAETERGLMSHTPVRLDVAAEEAVTLLHRAAADAGVRVEVKPAPVTVSGEQPLIERLVANLVHNAIKYNEPGGWVRVETAEPGTVIVANSGPVVAAQDVPGLFEPFRRLSGERLDQGGGGVGLGLTIVRSVAAAHAGSVDARANPEGGLTVTVRLPPGR